MKILRYRKGSQTYYGLLEKNRIQRLSGTPFEGMSPSGEQDALEEVALLTPCQPSKIVCLGLNYHDHAKEMDLAIPETPPLFMKPPTALLAPGGVIWYPPQTRELHYEAELAIVIGQEARWVQREEARRYILGYTCANDVTARDLQHLDGQWTRSKGFDTFLPLGPWIETELDPAALPISLTVNGHTRQQGNTRDLIFDVPDILAFVSGIMTLLPGDVILTGTPAGIGPMQVGDAVAVTIEGIGTLENTVAPRPA